MKKRGAKPCVHVHNNVYTRGSGGMLPHEILVFRLSETPSGAFSRSMSLLLDYK